MILKSIMLKDRLKSCILFDAIYMTLWKRQYYSNKDQLPVPKGCNTRGHKGTFEDDGIIPYFEHIV